MVTQSKTTSRTPVEAHIQPRFRAIDGLSIRYAESGRNSTQRGDALLLNPWPESLYAFEPTWAKLEKHAHLVAIDLPGFGHSEGRKDLMTPSAMGEFIIRAADAFGLDRPHVVGPDIGTSAALFAAASHPGRLRTIVIGTGGAAVPLQLGGALREWVEAADVTPYRGIGREIVTAVISSLERHTLSEVARADYLSAYEGDRFADSLSYVRSYPTELPALERLLPGISTPVLIINGQRDPVVPPVNATFLGERLPNSSVALIDAAHFIWEDAAEEYASLVIDWWNRRRQSS